MANAAAAIVASMSARLAHQHSAHALNTAHNTHSSNTAHTHTHTQTHSSSVMSGERVCVCGKPGVKTCSKCKTAGYCSRECQAKAWKDHKPLCKAAPPNGAVFKQASQVAQVEDASLVMWVALDVADGDFLHGAEKDTVCFEALVQNTQKDSIKVNPDTAYLMFDNKRVKSTETVIASFNGTEPVAGEKQVMLNQNQHTTVRVKFVVGKSDKPAKENIANLQTFVLPLRIDGKGVVKIEASLGKESLLKLL